MQSSLLFITVDLNEEKKEDEKLFNDPTFKLEPFVNYKISKYGNSKVVCLEQKSHDLRLQNLRFGVKT